MKNFGKSTGRGRIQGVPKIFSASRGHICVSTSYSSDNFGIYGPILIIFSHSLLYSEMNFTGSYTKAHHLPSIAFPHYLAKFECSSAQLFTHTCIGQNNLRSVRS